MVGRGMLCAAPSCNNYRRTSPGLSFFRFPSEKKRCLRWIINSRRTDLEEKFLVTSSSTRGGALAFSSCYYSLCGDHFTDCCFMNAKHRNRLVHDAVPSLFTVSPHNQVQLKGLVGLAKEEEDEGDAVNDGAGLDADMREALEESRSMELFINKKLQELESSGHDSMNVCIPHQHHGAAPLLSDSGSADLMLEEQQQMKSIEAVKVPNTLPASCLPGNVKNGSRTALRARRSNVKDKTTTFGSRNSGSRGTSHHSGSCNDYSNSGSNSRTVTPTLYYLCCSKACLSTSTNSTLFPFPSQRMQAKAWLERCGRSDLIPLLDTHGAVPNNFMLCEKHFRRNQFELEGAEGIALVCNAMPTIFNFIAERPCPDFKRKYNYLDDGSGGWGGIKVVATDRLMETITGDPGSGVQPLSSSAVSSEFCRRQGINPVTSNQQQIRQWQQRQHNKRQQAHAGPTRCSEEEEEEEEQQSTSSRNTKSNNKRGSSSSREHVGVSDVTRSTCAYKLCKPKKKKYPLYKFPQDPSRCLAWLKNCGYENLPSLFSSSVEPYISGYKLCAQHFQPSSFFTLSGQTKLLNYSVPTVFRHGPLQYPCQHKSLPERYRKCSHPNCKELIASGVYQSGIDDATQLVTVGNSRLRQQQQHSPPSHRRLPYIICDKAAVEEYDDGQEEDSPDEADYDDDGDEGRRLHHQEGNDKKSRAICIPFSTPMVFTDPKMTTQDKLTALDEEIVRLEKERAIFSFNLCRQRQSRFRYRRTLQALTLSYKKKDITQEDAMRFLQHRLSKSTYEFFLCQQLHRKCPPWNFDSVQIPAIANRCGLGVRETLYEIFKMPTLRTMSRYRQMIKKNPGSVPVDHLLKNDLEKKYHRRLIRKYRHQLPRSISSVINEYIGRRDDDEGLQGDQPHVSSTDDELATEGGRNRKASYHHKKYNSPQKWKSYGEQG